MARLPTDRGGCYLAPMDNPTCFMQYAAAFEETVKDDDWSRLHQYFTPDAVYAIESETFPAMLRGPDAIFAGMKKSLDGFDRKFERRDIAITKAPEVEGDEMRVGWTVTYTREGLPPFALRGSSVARTRDGRIAYLSDAYEPAMEQEFDEWRKKTGFAVDASYT